MFVIVTPLEQRLPFKTWTVATGNRRHIHRDLYGAPWTEDMALRFSYPMYSAEAPPVADNDNELEFHP